MNEQSGNMKNTVFLSMLRIIASVAVVAGHTKALTNDTTTGYMYFLIAIQWCVPVFFMITGYIFLGIKKNVGYCYVKKNIIKFLITLFTVGWFYAFLERLFVASSISVGVFMYSLADVFTGNLWAHMWYVYAAVGIYLILPVLSSFVSQSKKNLYTLTLICFIFNVVFTDVSTLCDVGFSFPLVDYCFYLLAGAVVYEMKEEKIRKLFLPSVLSLLMALAALVVRVYVFDVTTISSRNCIFVAIMTISIFIIINNICMSAKSSPFMDSLAKCTWGIYLIHPFYVNLFGKLFDFSFEKYNQFVAFPVAITVVFAISYLTVMIMRRIPLIKKII